LTFYKAIFISALIAAYLRLHQTGHAHSAEAWDGDDLAGGIYGVAIGKAFFGESMFYRKPNASKVGLVRMLEEEGYEFMDCQQVTKHTLRFGAEEWGGESY
jgi:leucyl/phenylalanyl-tRNA--protein transferase